MWVCFPGPLLGIAPGGSVSPGLVRSRPFRPPLLKGRQNRSLRVRSEVNQKRSLLPVVMRSDAHPEPVPPRAVCDDNVQAFPCAQMRPPEPVSRLVKCLGVLTGAGVIDVEHVTTTILRWE